MLCFITFFEVPKKAGDTKAKSKVRARRLQGGRGEGARRVRGGVVDVETPFILKYIIKPMVFHHFSGSRGV